MPSSPAPFIIEEYVRWSDVDFAGIIFYGASVRFFEIAETFRNRGIWKQQNGKWVLPGFLIPDWKWT